MAAILCLMFLPLMMASVGFLSAGTASSCIVFLLLGAFMIGVAFKMSRVWDDAEVRDQN